MNIDTSSQNYQKLKNVVFQCLDLEEHTDTDQLDQESVASWDSARHLVLVMEIEAQFGLSFKIEEVTEMRSFNDIILCLKSKGIAFN